MLRHVVGTFGFGSGPSVVALLLLGCGAAAPAPSAPKPKSEPKPILAPVETAEPPDPEAKLRPLRTGARKPIEEPRLDLGVAARFEDGAYEILELELPPSAAQSQRPDDYPVLDTSWNSAFVSLDAPAPGHAFPQYGLASKVGTAQAFQIWVRRPKSTTPVDGALYTSAYRGPGYRVPFHAVLGPKTHADSKLKQAWAAALANTLLRRADPGSLFAGQRVIELYGEKARVAKRDGRAMLKDVPWELGTLMDTTTGRLSVQRALANNRDIFFEASAQKQSVPLEKVRAPALASHPWAELSAALKRTAPDEPLARATPAEFYFVRARDFGKFLDLLSDLESFGEPAADLLDGHSEKRSASERYETELALERMGLTRLLGPQVVSELALVGSDPYLHEGSDVTLIFRLKNAALFSSALLGSLARRAEAHPGITESSFTEDGVSVKVRRSSDGRVRQHRASVGDLELVSNSPAAIRRVIRTLHGKQPSLAAEGDFQYMLARDVATPADELLYFGDRFVSTVVGPAQKIAEARRQLALAELSVPGYAALGLGLIDGHAPKTTADLLKSRWLQPKELKHGSGGAISFEPGHAARSSWGSVDTLEPLIDLPAVTRVTPAEQAGYEWFARSYEGMWSERIDPIALRLTQTAGAKGEHVLDADLRVLPTLRREYRDTMRTVGNARLSVPLLLGGLAGAIGLGEDASLRHELTSMSSFLGGGRRFTFDWLGDYALIGVAPTNELANAAHRALSEQIELPLDEERGSLWSNLGTVLNNLPLYAAVSVKSRVAASVFLGAMRGLARETAPGTVQWDHAASYRGTEVVAVRFKERGVRAALFYALTDDAFVLSMNERVLHAVIDQLANHPIATLANGKPDAKDAGQVVVELSGNKADALFTTIGWAASAGLNEASGKSRDFASLVLQGARDQTSDPKGARELMRAYLGTVVVTPDGGDYTLAPDGIRDPARGTPHAPIFPSLPVPSSSLASVLDRLSRVRSALSFDNEPAIASQPQGTQPLSSLHARVSLTLK